MTRPSSERGLSHVEMLVAVTILGLLSTALATFLVQNSRVNKSQRLRAAAQANARNCLSIFVQALRSAGWDPSVAGIPVVLTDPDPTDDVSQIEIFADLDADGDTDTPGERVLIRHIGNRVEWRRSETAPFEVLAVNVSNDADGDGSIEPMFVPLPALNPSRVQVQITARSAVPDPMTGDFVRYTVRSDVVLRKAL